MPSRFFWYELTTDDLAGAEAFYTAVLGWSTEHWGPPGEPPYVIVKAGETGIAGLMTTPDHLKAMGVPPCWTGYIHAADVDAAVESLTKAGGTVHRAPWDIPEIGRLAVVADPQGATFILMAPIGEGGGRDAAPMTPGHVGWHELYADDWAAALDFYSGQFGWTKADAIDMGPMGTYQLFATGGDPAGGMMNRPPEVPMPVWIYYFSVDGIDAAAARVTDNGGKLMMPPMEVPGGGWVAQCTDPQGAWFALVSATR